jgi:hypothetical protein
VRNSLLFAQHNLPEKHYASTVVEIAPMISLDNVSNNVQRSHHDIYEDHIALRNSLPILNSGLSSFCPLTDSGLRTASRHDYAKKKKKKKKKNPKGCQK